MQLNNYTLKYKEKKADVHRLKEKQNTLQIKDIWCFLDQIKYRIQICQICQWNLLMWTSLRAISEAKAKTLAHSWKFIQNRQTPKIAIKGHGWPISDIYIC